MPWLMSIVVLANVAELGKTKSPSRMRLGIPEWYNHLLSACITKIKSLITFSLDSVSLNYAITAFLQLQQTIPALIFLFFQNCFPEQL